MPHSLEEIWAKLEYIERQLQTHMGTQQGVPTAQQPHPNMGVRSGVYTVSNLTTDRTYDANSTTTDELADVLGTLITDLKVNGILA